MATHIEIVTEFSALIQSSLGRVTLVTEQGDRLVADSLLSALVGFASIISVAETLNVQFDCENPADCARIDAFMAKHALGRYRRT